MTRVVGFIPDTKETNKLFYYGAKVNTQSTRHLHRGNKQAVLIQSQNECPKHKASVVVGIGIGDNWQVQFEG